jgi:hypothetical protein
MKKQKKSHNWPKIRTYLRNHDIIIFSNLTFKNQDKSEKSRQIRAMYNIHNKK